MSSHCKPKTYNVMFTVQVSQVKNDTTKTDDDSRNLSMEAELRATYEEKLLMANELRRAFTERNEARKEL